MKPQEILAAVRELNWDILLVNNGLDIRPKGKATQEDVDKINKLEPLVIEHKFAIREILISGRIADCLFVILKDNATTFKTLQFGERKGYCELILHVKSGGVRAVWQHRERVEEFVGEITGLPVQFSCKEVEA